MVGPYRLKEFALRLPEGAGLLAVEDLAPVARASELLAEAEARAAAIVAEARAVFEAEKRRGFEEGLAEARREALQMLIAESRELDAAIRSVDRDLTDIVVSAVRKIVEDFDDVTKAEAVVRTGLRKMRKARRAELQVPRALAPHFRERIGAIVAEFPDCDHVDVVESDELSGSDVVLETAIGRVEGDLAVAADEVEEIVRRGLKARMSAANHAAVMESWPADPEAPA